jgi:hypothetical protein
MGAQWGRMRLLLLVVASVALSEQPAFARGGGSQRSFSSSRSMSRSSYRQPRSFSSSRKNFWVNPGRPSNNTRLTGTPGQNPKPGKIYYAPGSQPKGPTNAGAGTVRSPGAGSAFLPPVYPAYSGYAAPAAYAGQTAGGWAMLVGRVTRGGYPVPHATVRVANLGRTVVTGPDGRYTLSQLSPTVVHLQAFATGYPTSFKNYTLSPSQTYTVNFDLAGAGPGRH